MASEEDLRVARGVVREVDRHFDASERLRLGKWIDPDERERTIAQYIATAITAARAEQREVDAKIADTHSDCELHPQLVRETVVGYHLAAKTIAAAIRAGKE